MVVYHSESLPLSVYDPKAVETELFLSDTRARRQFPQMGVLPWTSGESARVPGWCQGEMDVSMRMKDLCWTKKFAILHYRSDNIIPLMAQSGVARYLISMLLPRIRFLLFLPSIVNSIFSMYR